MTFEIMTTLVVLVIFGVFYLAAHKAEQVVAAKAKAKLEQQQNTIITAAPLTKKEMKADYPMKKDKPRKKDKVIV